ncbi:MAG: FtsW/RodA/SpoVE family cell cycle protein [Bacteroidaceae bacterium]|nr:FtsW/RodA/SpoVE family cell cycle protein [Bacteroidaceae bacterium]MDY5673220.1 FtsW/RodA/SpoVE family cell cycle protein [Bacteroidaceae bacterium]MEE1241895.1 FtsW/RodA/SpoVE family cell cycle protein [Bacteroidaceae bacterium]
MKKKINWSGLMQGDLVIWMVFILLLMISVVEVYSASSTMSYGGKSSYWEPVMQHGSFWLIGLVTAWFVSRVPCNYFKLGGTLGLLFALMLQLAALFSGKLNGAGRWIHLWGLTFQPSELTKMALVTYLAFIFSSLRNGKEVSSTGNKFAAFGAIASLALIVTENLSTAGLIFLIVLGMAFFAQVRAKLLAIIFVIMVSVGAGGWILVHSIPEETLSEWRASENPITHRVPTWVARITDKHEIPDNPKDYDITDNIQVTHARIAVATSHGIGKGPGKSRQRDYLPQAYSDFIYAIIIEETGILGGLVVMFLYLLFMWRCRTIAERCKSLFPSYLVMGLSLMIVLQAMVNMAVAVGAMPVTGQPLPLISRGGSSILINCICVGMILSVSRTAKKTGEPAGSAPTRDEGEAAAGALTA